MKNETIRQFVRRELRAAVTMGVATAIGMSGGLPAAMAHPVGGAVVSGQGSITSPNSTTTLINQQSNSLTLNWSSFNVASNETVQFVQPSSTSVALNNILSQSPSQIFGKIDANGRVVLINPNGILFGRTAQLNVGSLIASSLELKEFDPTTGRLTFQSLSGKPGVIDNEGSITAGPGGSVALLGGTVLNNGLVVADYGTVAMGAGNVATLDFYGGGLLRLQVSGDLKTNATGAAAAVQNNGQIQANGGQVVLTASATQDVFASAVNNTGVIRANRVENVGGVIELSGPDGVVANSGTLDARGKGAGSTGGTVEVTGNDVGLFGTSTIDVSGPAGGGTVLVGGGFHGADSSIQDASRTYVGADTTIDADATTSGNGGNVAVWSNDGTRYYGNISAQGAGQGSGGFAEVSGKGYLDYEGLTDLRAPSGKLGTLLLDPTEITIDAAATDVAITTGGGPTGPFTDASNGANSVLTEGTINTQLSTSDVTVTTGTGDIVISGSAGAVALGAGGDAGTLTLTSGANISWDAAWSYTSSGQLTLYAHGAGGTISAGATGEPIAIGGTSPVLLQASAGIGSSAVPVETTGLTSVAADGGTGGVYISNGTTGAVTVTTLTNPATATAVNGLNAGTAVSLVNNAGSITLSQPVTAGTGSATLQAVGVGAALALGTNNVTGAGVTLQGNGVTQSSGSTVDAGAGDILVDGGGGAVNLAGSLTTTSNTATAATVKDATTVALPAITTGATGTTTIGAGDISGAVTQSGTTVISTGTLTGSTTGTVTLGNANTIPTVGAFTSTGFTFNDGDLLSITGTLAGGAGNVDLTSSGAISESGAGLISTTGTLTTSSVGGTTLGGANVVANFNGTNTTSGNVSLTNNTALTITGISQSGGGTATVNNAGGTTVTGTVGAGAGSVTLTDTTGAISESGAGLISTTGTLTTSSVGGTTLNGANSVAGLNATNATSGNFSLANGAALDITGLTQASGGSITINNAGGTTLNTAINAGTASVTLKDTTGILALGANNVSGAGVTLQGVGVTQSAGSTVDAGAGDILVDGGGGAVSMAGSLTTTSNTATAATVKNATTVALPAITTGASGTTTIGAGDISNAVTQSGTTVISTGTLTGSTTGSVALGHANTIPTLGAFTSNGFTLNDGDALGIAGALAGGAAAVNLTSSGTISEGGGGLISTTGTLTTHSTGGTTLGGSNAVGTFGATNAGGAVTLANAAGLTITGLSQTGGGLVSVTNTAPITLSGTNSTDGSLSLTSSGGGVTLGSTGSDVLNVGGTLSVSANGSIIEGTGSSATAVSSQLTLVSPAGDLILKNAAGLGPITLVGTGRNLDLEGTNQTQVNSILGGGPTWTGAVTLADGTAITLPNFNVGGALAVTAPGISQSGALNVGTTTTLTATGNPITLTDAGNSFGGEVDFSGSTLTLASTGPLLSAGTASGNLGETAGGNISEGAAGIQLTGTAGANTATFTVTGATHDVDLGSAANNFNVDAVTVAASGAGAVGNVRVADANATALSLTLPGTLMSLVLSDPNAPIVMAGGSFTGVGAGTNLAGGTTTLAVTAGGAVTQTGALLVTGTSAFSANGGTSDINLSNTGNAFSGGVMLTGNNVTLANTAGTTVAGASTAGNLTLDAGAAVAFGATGADSTTVTGNLVAQGLSGSGATGGSVTQAGTLTVGGTTSIDAGTNDITLSNSGNGLTGAVTLIGGAVTLANSRATILGGANDAGSLTLDAGGAVTFGTTGTDSTTVASNLVVRGAGGGGAAGGAVSEVGTLSVGGTTSIDTNNAAISLDNAANSFAGNVSFTGGAVTLVSTGALSTSGTASGNLAETAAGTITEGAAGIQLTGTAGTNTATFTVTGGTYDVDLDPANNFNGEATTITASAGGAVGNVAVEDTNATFVPLILPASFASLVLSDPNAPIAIVGVTLTGVGGGTNLTGGTATLAVTAGGAITQSGALSVNGTTALNANGGASDITLSNAANAFSGGIALSGNNVTVANTAGTTIAGASTAGSLTLDAGGAVTFGTASSDSTTVTNNLIVQGLSGSGATGGAVTQVGKLSVGGTTSINAGTNAVTLSNAANAFAGSVTLTGGAVTLANARATTLAGSSSIGSLTLNAGGAVAFGASGSDSTTVTNNLIVQGVSGSGAAGGAVTEGGKLSVGTTASITAGTNDITLGQANTFGGNVAFVGRNVTLTTGTGGLMTSGTASGTLTETSAGAITQGGALSVTGLSTLTANGGAGDITLSNAANAFTGAVTLSGATVTLANASATTLAGPEKLGSLTLDAGGAVTFGATSTDTTTVTNGLIVQGVSGSGNAGGAVTQAATISVGTTTLIQAGANDINLGLMNTFGGGVTFNGRNVLLNAKGSLTAASGTASGTLTAIAQGASANLNVGTLSAGGNLLLIAGSSILGTSAQSTVTATNAQVRYGIEDANGQLGSATNPSQQIGFQTGSGASQVQLTVWLPAPGTQLQATDLRPTQSDLSITKQAFQGGSISALYSPNFGLTAAQVGSTVLSSTAAIAGTQTQSAQAQSAATQGSQSVLIIDWGSYNPNVSLFGTLNPAVCLPADQRDESVGSGSGCAAASASLLEPPAPIQLAMVPTQEGWRAMPLFSLVR